MSVTSLVGALMQPQTITLLCFAILGALTGRDMQKTGPLVLVYAIATAALAWLSVRLLAWLAGRLSSRQDAQTTADEAAKRGFLMIVPFTALALLADLIVGWHATQAFTAAGILTAGASAAAELEANGEPKPSTRILLTVAASALAVLWIVLSSLSTVGGR